ncbi:MAG TPA: acyl-CoA dehydrogenase family protein [Actinomycetota bacterium]|nr:acyl-CoA dehydrogenase family protein [Actinomycetota bacterium]
MTFFQEPPALTNTFRSDTVLREHLERLLPAELLAEATPELDAMGEAAAGPLARLAARAEAAPPRLVPYDPWGRRVDRIEVSAAWKELVAAQARAGLVAVAYDGRHGPHGRVLQHALLHVYGPSSAVATCPLAMTDAAVRVLADHAQAELRDRVVPLLTSREPERAWTSGQWMTEREGGSDVGHTATVARRDEQGRWRLHGVKWFTSATTADCALALARPAGASGGSRGLGLFLVEAVDPLTGRSQLGETILVNRLKDKLGTRAMPTAELTLAGAAATPVGGIEAGLKKITGMLNVTRVHNGISAAAGMRRGIELAVAYARVRQAFGQPLRHLPLHRETLVALAVEAEAAFALVARAAELLGRAEHGLASERQQRALRALVPAVKLVTAKDAVAHASEVVECFGGAGYIEDTGIPRLLRDAQVLPIWEGTTNVLSLDLARAERTDQAVTALLEDLEDQLEPPRGWPEGAERAAGLDRAGDLVGRSLQGLAKELRAFRDFDAAVVQAHLRGFAMRLGRCYAAGLLVAHAAHRLARHGDERAARVAGRYADRWLTGPPPPMPTLDQLDRSAALLATVIPP